MPSDFTVVAIIAAFNEADIIGSVVRELIGQGISIYLLDDGSTDGTAEAVEPYTGRGVIRIERLRTPGDGSPAKFAWEQILLRKAQLATELDADWFIHHDADEFRESPWPGVSLKEAIERVDALGYNAIDFASLEFRPTRDGFRPSDDIRETFPFYSEGAAYNKVQIRSWKKTSHVDLASTGGHEARFNGRNVFPIRFLLRHYPIRGQAHGHRKVFDERKPRFIDEERSRGWHVQYDDVVEGTSFIHDPCKLTRYDPIGVRVALSIRHRSVEALERSLDDTQRDLQNTRVGLESVRSEVVATTAELASKDREIERLQRHLDGLRMQLAQSADEIAAARNEIAAARNEIAAAGNEIAANRNEIAASRKEIAGLTNALDHRNVEVDNLQAAVADFTKQLDALRRSLSWRWTAPARAAYRLLTGRS